MDRPAKLKEAVVGQLPIILPSEKSRDYNLPSFDICNSGIAPDCWIPLEPVVVEKSGKGGYCDRRVNPGRYRVGVNTSNIKSIAVQNKECFQVNAVVQSEDLWMKVVYCSLSKTCSCADRVRCCQTWIDKQQCPELTTNL